MKTLAYSVLAFAVILAVAMFLIGVFTPAPAHAYGSCTATKGSGVCRPNPRPTCWPGRRCA